MLTGVNVTAVGFVRLIPTLKGTEEVMAFLDHCLSLSKQELHKTCDVAKTPIRIKNLDINPCLQHLFTAYSREPF